MKLLIVLAIVIVIVIILFIKCNGVYITRRILRTMAIDIIDTFNICHIDYWVDFGTLLGIIREGDIILGDNDVDICVVESPELHEKMKMAKSILEEKGYTFTKESWDAYRFKKYYRVADIYINKINRERNIYHGAEGDKSDISIDYIQPTSIVKWKNVDVKCPSKINETLVYRYGCDWRTPKKDYKGRLENFILLLKY
jgi:hypothetical protein